MWRTCCEFISSCSSHIVCRVGHLPRGMEFYDQLIRLVYYLYNNWFWRLWDYVSFEALQRKLDQGEVSGADGVIVPGLALTLPWMVRFGVSSCLLNYTVDSLDDIRDFRNRYFSCWSSLVTNMKTLLCGRSENYNTTEGRDEDHQSSYENNQVASL